MTLSLDAASMTTFDDLIDESVLRARLDRVRAPEERVFVGIAVGGERAYAASGPAGVHGRCRASKPAARARTRTAPPYARESPIRAGCLAKLFTAALAVEADADGVLGLDDPIACVLPAAEKLRGTTMRELLEHRHGLDDSLVTAPPRRRDGHIAADALVERLRAEPPLAAPGRLYSYSNAGAWLAAAALEHLARRSFAALLGRVLHGHRGRRVCPALGGELEVSLEALLDFALTHAPEAAGALGAAPLDGHASADAVSPRAANGTRIGTGRGGAPCGEHASYAPLPGWSPFERGVRLGWKLYGRGWVGHNSNWPGAFALVRVEPRARIALVLASTARPAAAAAARLFGPSLPDVASLRMPRPCGTAPERPFEPSRCAGLYRSAAMTVRIACDGPGALALEIGGAAHMRRLALRRRAGDVFFTEPPDAEFPFVQLIDACEGGFRYLWNGRFVLRNAACPAAA